VAAASAAVVLIGVGLAGPATARADDPGVALSVASVTPNVWVPGATLAISGAVTNNTGAALSGAHVVLWASTTALTTVADFDAALAADPATPAGAVVPGAGVALGADEGGNLPDGAQASFTVTGQPRLTTAGAAYLVGVQVLDSHGYVLARARVGLAVAADDQPTAGALVVPLTSRPSLVTPGDPKADPPIPAVFSDDHLADDLQGSLGQSIALAGQPGVTALLDPALVDELTQMADGYVVAAGTDATPTPGAGQDAAKAALTSIYSIAGGNAYRLPNYDPDIVALAGLPQAAAVLADACQAPTDGVLAILPLAVVANGAVTDQVAALVDGVKPAVVLSDALQGATVQQVADGVPWVALTPAAPLSPTGPGPDFGGAATLQPPLNRTALLTIAEAQGTPIVTMATTADDVTAAADWLDAGGATGGLTGVLATLAPSPIAWQAGATASAPSPDLLAAVAQTQQNLALLADLGNQPQVAADLGNQVLPGAVSSAWDGDWASALGWFQQATADLTARASGGSVSLHVAGQWMLSSRDNRVPITITNDMAMPVNVRVRFDSENPARLNVPETDVVTVAPKASSTVIVNPLAEANGSVQVTVALVTINNAPVGVPQVVQVTTTSAGRLGWVIIIGAGLVFVILTSLRVRQVRRQRAKSKIDAMTPAAPPGAREPTEGGDAHVD